MINKSQQLMFILLHVVMGERREKRGIYLYICLDLQNEGAGLIMLFV
jgi:hypothetical protein